MAQMAQVQGQANPISRVGIAKPAKGEALKLVIQLPVNVTLAAASSCGRRQGPGPARAVQALRAGRMLRRARPQGRHDEEILAPDASPGDALKDGTDHDVAIPLSFKGFGLAFDALLKQ